MLGHQAERAAATDVRGLIGTLTRLTGEEWSATTPLGETVAHVVAHLAEGTQRLADAWRRRVDAEADEALLHTFDGTSKGPAVEMDVSDTEAVVRAYRRATADLQATLGAVLDQDWAWPVWSPLGGAETLAEAARRWVAHHHVHRGDIQAALGRSVAADEDTTRLAAEFSLDAIARRGSDAVTPPLAIEVVTSTPGAATWTLIFEEPRPRDFAGSVWQALVGHHPEALEEHRLEHGSSDAARLRIKGDGRTVWRAAFGRGRSWADLEVHGDDDAKDAWKRLLDAVTAREGSGLAPVQH